MNTSRRRSISHLLMPPRLAAKTPPRGRLPQTTIVQNSIWRDAAPWTEHVFHLYANLSSMEFAFYMAFQNNTYGICDVWPSRQQCFRTLAASFSALAASLAASFSALIASLGASFSVLTVSLAASSLSLQLASQP